MSLISLRHIVLSFGTPPLFDRASLVIKRGDRLAIVGRNGAGKSTLMAILQGIQPVDDGEIVRQSHLVVARMQQEVPEQGEGTVFDVVAEGLGETGELLRRWHLLSLQGDLTADRLAEMEQVQEKLEQQDGWLLKQRVESILSRLDLPGEAVFSGLSGGMKRRVLLAQALVQEPDILLLDEPTNHLDIPSIEWLESFLLEWPGTLVCISHDRAFLQRLATAVVDVDRGKITRWDGDFANYLRRKEEALQAEQQQQGLFDKKLAEEEQWIRQGIKARRTRNEGRVRALQAMREEYRARRKQQGEARMAVNQGEHSGKIVCEAKQLCYDIDGKPLIEGFNFVIQRGDKIGIIGPNGAGKSTLVNLLLGRLKPASGSVRLGTNLQIAYFDQLRESLDDNATVYDTVAEGSDQVTINGRQKHVMSYLQDFLFPPQRARALVSSLSGGERNRLLLARLFTRPANLLVLDEPTNDLDMETLELLESLLVEFEGTLLLISHDRDFLDNVVTSTLVFEEKIPGEGYRIQDYAGGYRDWLLQRPDPVPERKGSGKPAAKPRAEQEKVKPAKGNAGSSQDAGRRKKLSYKDQRELDALPALIESLEQELGELQQQLSDPALFQNDPAKAAELGSLYSEKEQALEAAFARWGELES